MRISFHLTTVIAGTFVFDLAPAAEQVDMLEVRRMLEKSLQNARAIERGARPNVLLDIAQTYVQTGDRTAAEELFRQATQEAMRDLNSKSSLNLTTPSAPRNPVLGCRLPSKIALFFDQVGHPDIAGSLSKSEQNLVASHGQTERRQIQVVHRLPRIVELLDKERPPQFGV